MRSTDPRTGRGDDDAAWVGRTDPLGATLIGAAGLLVMVAAIRLWSDAAAGVFASDECFHVTAATTILRTHGLPAEFPQFYSGFFYYYPPLFHVIGALWALCLGPAALHVLPPALFIATLLVLALAGRRLAPPGAAAAAALVVCSHPTVQLYAVRFYVEGLVALLGLTSAVLLVAWWRSPAIRTAVALGLVLGLGLLAKFNGWLPLALVVVSGAVASRKGSSRPARHLWLAVLLASGLAVPVLVRNQVLYGSALYPFGAPGLDSVLYALNRERFSIPIGEFYAALPRALGPPLGGLAALALAVAGVRRRFGPWEGVLTFALLSMLVIPLAPYAAERHLLPFLVIAALAGAASLFENLAALPSARTAVLIAALIVGVTGQLQNPNPRVAVDEPEELQVAFRQIAPLLGPDDRVLTYWTYDTAYYTPARATWPSPWGQRERLRPIFEQTDPERLVTALREHGIGWLLMPASVRARSFDSTNFPESFARCVNEALKREEMTIAWKSDAVALLRLGGPGR